MKEVVIIGGGASGLICASSIKEHDHRNNLHVIIVERLEKIGKKILATGNGKCNFTNKKLSAACYNNPQFVSEIINKNSYRQLVNYFDSIGLVSKEISEGRIYPYSEAASTVLDTIRYHVNHLGVEIRCNYEVNDITYKDNKYYIYNKNQRNYAIPCDYVVFACGGKAYPILGSNGSGYGLLKPFKVQTTPVLPGLVGLKTSDASLKVLNGLRVKGVVSVTDKKTKKKIFENSGEIIFKEDGISGIVIMDASNQIARIKATPLIEIDLLPGLNEEKLMILLATHKAIFGESELSQFFTGIFPRVLGSLIITKAKLNITSYGKDLRKKDLEKLTEVIKHFTIEYKETYGFDRAQITLGGVALNEIEKSTLAIKKMHNAYICGEMLDIDGICGGFNLSWAFASGMHVGKIIAAKENDLC